MTTYKIFNWTWLVLFCVVFSPILVPMLLYYSAKALLVALASDAEGWSEFWSEFKAEFYDEAAS